MPERARPSRLLWLGLVTLVVAIAVGGYAFTGSPRLAGIGAPPAVPVEAGAPPDAEREIGLAQISAMVDKLATRMKELISAKPPSSD